MKRLTKDGQLGYTTELWNLTGIFITSKFTCPFHPLGWTLLGSVNVNGKVMVSVGNGSCNFPSLSFSMYTFVSSSVIAGICSSLFLLSYFPFQSFIYIRYILKIYKKKGKKKKSLERDKKRRNNWDEVRK